MRFRFSMFYFLGALLLFILEVLIASIFSQIYFLRAFVGDILVVIWLYFVLCSFFEFRDRYGLIFLIFIFAMLVEISQYFKIAEILGFREGSVGYIVLGNYFSVGDIICYAVGCLLLCLWIKIKKGRV